MVMSGLLLIIISILLLVVELSTDGLAWLRYAWNPIRCEALVQDEVPFTFDCSKGIVERKEDDGSYSIVGNSGDKSVGHAPFYHLLFEKGKYQYILEWEAEGRCWRGHYPYLKKKGEWRIGDRIELHCQAKKPWNYAVRDERVWRTFLVKCMLIMLLIFVGILMVVYAA